MNKITIPKGLKQGEYRLNVGCGDKSKWIRNANIRLDIRDFGQDLVWDVRKGIPLPDDSCEHILSSHFVEHIRPEEFMEFMNECWRVLKKDCELYIITPSINNDRAWIPPHINHLNKETLKFFEGLREKETETSVITNEQEGRIKFWNITDLVENDRHDLHCHMTPKK